MFWPAILVYLSTLIVLRIRRDWAARRMNEPPILPYWLPFLGHVFRYARDSQNLFLAARDFSPESKPVSLTIFGKRIYIVTAEKDISAVYRSKKLQFTPIITQGMKNIFDMTEEGLETFVRQPDGPGLSLAESMHPFFRDALKEGPALGEFATRFIQVLENELQNFDQESCAGGHMPLELYDWVKARFGRSSTVAMMGDEILNFKPDLVDGLWRFEADFPKLTMGLPRWVFKKENTHRDGMVAAFRHVYEENLQSGAVWWIIERQKIAIEAGFSVHDSSSMTLGLWVAAETNPKAAIFWLLARILNIPGLANCIRRETGFAFAKGAGRVAISQLIYQAPLLRSMYYEVLRFYSSSISFRTVVEDTAVSGYTFRKGALVMCPALPRHFDASCWGPDAMDFVPNRFIRPSAGGLLKGNEKMVRAFGGGTSLCPGRHFAAQEIVAFVAVVLNRYNFWFVGGEVIPDVDRITPVAGMLGPASALRLHISFRT